MHLRALLIITSQTPSSSVQITSAYSVVQISSPDPTPKRRKGSGDIGTDSWFCKLSNHVIICIGLQWSMCCHVMVRTGAHDQEKASNVPRPFPHVRGAVGSGNKTDGEVGRCHDHQLQVQDVNLAQRYHNNNMPQNLLHNIMVVVVTINYAYYSTIVMPQFIV